MTGAGRRCGLAAACALAAALAAAPARAGSEEFATFDLFRQEEDDESLLDHLLTRPPGAWRESWERAAAGLRGGQGCLTSGQWFVATDLRTTAPLGERAQFGFTLRDRQSDRESFTYSDFSFRMASARGAVGFWFRPLFDKSRQDLGLFWETAAETAAAHLRLTFTLEDVFNNLWAFRQSRVGDASEPYEKHPFEPALRAHWRGEVVRAELDAQVLTPSRKQIPHSTGERHVELWGTWARGALELGPRGGRVSLTGENRQARGRGPSAVLLVDEIDWRRQWSVELAGERSFGTVWTAEARWLYAERDQARVGDGSYYIPDVTLGATDRVLQLEVRRGFAAAWWARGGLMLDRITVAAGEAPGATPSYRTYGSRTESRAYLGLGGRLGRVHLSVVEGFELDREPYEVWWVHDKAFLHLQTTF